MSRESQTPKPHDSHKRASFFIMLLIALSATAQTIWHDNHAQPTCSRCIAGAMQACYGTGK